MSGELPDGWRLARLGEICEIVNGSTPKSGVDEYWDGDICWITPADLGQLDEPYIGQSSRTITRSGYDSCSTTLVPPGSVVMSSRAPIGHLGIAATSLCTNQGCKAFVPTTGVESKYLYHALQNSMEDIRALGSGATFPEVSKRTLAAFAIPLPQLEEQRRIADTMSIAERARSAASGQLAAVDELSGALLREIFPRSPAARLPRGWRSVTLGEVCEINPRRPSDLRPTDNTAVTFIPMKAVGAGGIGVTEPEVRPYHTVARGYTYMEDGDVIFAKITPCMQNGKHATVRDALNGFAFGSTEFHVIRPVEEIEPLLLHRFLMRSEFLEEAQRHFTGTAGQQRVPKEFLSATVFPLPPTKEQRRIGRAFSAIEDARAAAIAQLAAIDELSDTLLKRLFAPPAG